MEQPKETLSMGPLEVRKVVLLPTERINQHEKFISNHIPFSVTH